MFTIKTLIAVLIVAFATSPVAVAAWLASRNDSFGLGAISSGALVGAPGPVAGVGLPILAVAGGLFWLRKRRSARPAQESHSAEVDDPSQ